MNFWDFIAGAVFVGWGFIALWCAWWLLGWVARGAGTTRARALGVLALLQLLLGGRR